MEQITVTTSDHERFLVDFNIIEMSNLIRFIVEQWPDREEIQVPFKGKTIKILLEYCDYHNYINPALKSKPLDEYRANYQAGLEEWEKKLLSDIQLKHLIDLMNAADYLEMDSLVSFCACSIAANFARRHGKVVQYENGIDKDYNQVANSVQTQYSHIINPDFNLNRDS
jgi:hypothetical protein